ncbi:peptidase U35 [Melaminivora suipulveris]|uniref:Peptidase U35 n=1 Tax=Melaminivora suipulveris TaxID=2109913 RepID=A0A2R3Q9R7_9BURK|nr:HK97 family phage prohead protease [Melaminivora suipulveris]AVO48533.1 peptidase U35 [Melaminivora suipulveris]
MKTAANLTIKSVQAEAGHYVVQGLATTRDRDMALDIVEPLGAEVTLPLPLLLEHDRARPVGQVVQAQAAANGISFTAHIPKVQEAGIVRERIMEVVHSLMHGLLRGTSIGFQPLEDEPLPGGGRRFRRWRWLELSIVSVPCNPFAAVASVKSLEHGHPASRTAPARHSVPLLQRQGD